MDQPNNQVRIVTDTTASLPMQYARAKDIEVVPQVVLLGDESYLETYELAYHDFLQWIYASKEMPKTAAPPPGEFIAGYERQLSKGDTILSIHPSSEVSGTVRSAQTAKADAFPDADIRILDTRTIGGNLASMVMQAQGMADAGASADEIIDHLHTMMQRSKTYFLVSTLEYLRRGGRIGGASALVGSALRMKPILHLVEGRVDVFEKVRTQHKAYERMMELITGQCADAQDAALTILQADSMELAEQFQDDLCEKLGISDIPILEAGAAITTHAGPGVLAVGFFH